MDPARSESADEDSEEENLTAHAQLTDDEEILDALNFVRQCSLLNSHREEAPRALVSTCEGEEADTEYFDSGDDEGSWVDSEEETEEGILRTKPKLPKYDPCNPTAELEVGMKFREAEELKDALYMYSCLNRREFVFSKNNQSKIRASCAFEGCPWFLYAVWFEKKGQWEIRTQNSLHNCPTITKNRWMTSKWLARHFLASKLQNAPGLKTKELKNMVRTELGCEVAYEVVRKGRKILRQSSHDPTEEYKLLWRYAKELRRSNPGTVVEIETICGDNGKQYFLRLYICFPALREGWKAGCRPIIGLDGCFLKTSMKGQLLSAVGRDGNNQMFPIAWAVVEAENTSSWNWFFESATARHRQFEWSRAHNHVRSTKDSKTLKEEKREELFENLKAEESIGWEVDVIDPRELSAKMLRKNKINLNEISHQSAIGLIKRVLSMGVLLTEVYLDTVGDAEKYRTKLSEIFPAMKIVVAKKADSLYPVVSGASIVAKVTRDRALRNWVADETAENMNRNFGSGYPGDPETKAWLKHHRHPLFGFPALVRFSWGTCDSYFKDGVEVLWESDKVDEDCSSSSYGKRQLKLSNIGFTTSKRKSEDIESSGKGRCKFLQARKLEQVTQF